VISQVVHAKSESEMEKRWHLVDFMIQTFFMVIYEFTLHPVKFHDFLGYLCIINFFSQKITKIQLNSLNILVTTENWK
jgi:hypothetical protein